LSAQARPEVLEKLCGGAYGVTPTYSKDKPALITKLNFTYLRIIDQDPRADRANILLNRPKIGLTFPAFKSPVQLNSYFA
jgi:hypothetical protein